MENTGAGLRESLARAGRNEGRFRTIVVGGIMGGVTVNPVILAGCLGGSLPYALHAFEGRRDARNAVRSHLSMLYLKLGKPGPTGHDITNWIFKMENLATALKPPPLPLHQQVLAYMRGEAYAAGRSTQPQSR